jgi:hypothetical protein
VVPQVDPAALCQQDECIIYRAALMLPRESSCDLYRCPEHANNLIILAVSKDLRGRDKQVRRSNEESTLLTGDIVRRVPHPIQDIGPREYRIAAVTR